MVPLRSSLRDALRRFGDPVWMRRWALAHRDLAGWRAFGVRQLEILAMTARNLREEEILIRAAALTYRTLLAIVPLFAVTFALFKAFGGLRGLEAPLRSFVLESLAAGRAEELGAWLDGVLAHVNAGAIAGVSLLLLFYSAIGLLTSIEGAFNKIFGIAKGRRWIARFLMYWAMLTIMPPLIGYSVSITARLENSVFAARVLGWLPFGVGGLIIATTTTLAVCLVFVLSYYVVPNTRVRFRAALMGGLVAGVLWNLSKALFIKASAGSLQASAIYGALGVLPMLMLWIQLSWLIVLMGAAYTCANQSQSTGQLDLSDRPLSPAFAERLAARLLLLVAERFRAGEPPLDAEELAEGAGTLGAAARRVLSALTAGGLLAETPGRGGATAYLPGRDPSGIDLAQVRAALRAEGTSFELAEEPAMRRLDAALDEAEAAASAVLAAAPLARGQGGAT